MVRESTIIQISAQQVTTASIKQEMGYATTLTTQHAIEFLDHRQKDKPFCLYVHHKAPHRSWFAEPKHIGMYDGVDFPLPKTFWDNYENRGSAAKTQKMNIEKIWS